MISDNTEIIFYIISVVTLVLNLGKMLFLEHIEILIIFYKKCKKTQLELATIKVNYSN